VVCAHTAAVLKGENLASNWLSFLLHLPYFQFIMLPFTGSQPLKINKMLINGRF
jgi:hypothetical protein